jgi:hypothetical protein
MKITPDTMTILKNFSSINQSIIFKAGNLLKTISPQKTVMAFATIEEDFPIQAGIYNLPRFLSVCGMHESPELEFGDTAVMITEGKSKTKYIYADTSMIIAPPEKEIKLPSVDVSITLSSENLSKVLKAATVLQLPEIAFVGEDGICYLRAINSLNPLSDSFGVELGKTDDTFTLIMKAENLQVLPFEYEVELSSKGISRFKTDKVTYFIAIESKSTYEKGN